MPAITCSQRRIKLNHSVSTTSTMTNPLLHATARQHDRRNTDCSSPRRSPAEAQPAGMRTGGPTEAEARAGTPEARRFRASYPGSGGSSRDTFRIAAHEDTDVAARIMLDVIMNRGDFS